MIKQKSKMYRKPEIDISGPDGNAFVIMGAAREFNRQLKLNKDMSAIVAEMTSGDYEHLLQVFDREFGDYVDIIR